LPLCLPCEPSSWFQNRPESDLSGTGGRHSESPNAMVWMAATMLDDHRVVVWIELCGHTKQHAPTFIQRLVRQPCPDPVKGTGTSTEAANGDYRLPNAETSSEHGNKHSCDDISRGHCERCLRGQGSSLLCSSTAPRSRGSTHAPQRGHGRSDRRQPWINPDRSFLDRAARAVPSPMQRQEPVAYSLSTSHREGSADLSGIDQHLAFLERPTWLDLRSASSRSKMTQSGHSPRASFSTVVGLKIDADQARD
jgi:hypothetical protein